MSGVHGAGISTGAILWKPEDLLGQCTPRKGAPGTGPITKIQSPKVCEPGACPKISPQTIMLDRSIAINHIPSSTNRELSCSLPAPSTPPSVTPRNCSPPKYTNPKTRLHTKQPPLRKALLAQNLRELTRVLADDPSAAEYPFLDHNMEPPLVLAIRTGCDVEIVALLLKHGASFAALDVEGRTALAALSSKPRRAPNTGSLWNWNAFPQLEIPANGYEETQSMKIAACLMNSGADPHDVDPHGKTPVDRASQFGHTRLARFLKYARDVQVWYVLHQSCDSLAKSADGNCERFGTGWFCQLPGGTMQAICKYILPQEIIQRITEIARTDSIQHD